VSAERDRTRAVFGLAVGVSTLGCGVWLDLGFGSMIPLEWAISGLGLAIASQLAVFIVRPRSAQIVSAATWILAGIAALLMAAIGVIDPPRRNELLAAGVIASGGGALLMSMLRFAFARASRTKRRSPLDAKHKLMMTKSGETKPSKRPISQIDGGDLVEVPSKEIVPADGEITRGEGVTDDRAITASDVPVVRSMGDPILAGSVPQIPDLIIRAIVPYAESLILRRERHLADLAKGLERDRKSAKTGALVVVLVSLALCGTLVAYRFEGGLGDWLPLVAGLLLASASGAPLVALRGGLGRLIAVGADRGIVFGLPSEAVALARARRWQIDPRLLAHPGEVEAIALAEVPPARLIAIANALLEETEGPDRDAIIAEMTRRDLAPPRPAALKRDRGLWYGTVSGERWIMGPASTLANEEKLAVEPHMQGPMDFLKEKSSMVWLLATPKEVVGAIGLGLRIEEDAKAAASALKATLMPGLPDGMRRQIAASSGLECDGPPLGSRDVTIGGPLTPSPSSGTLIITAEPQPRLAIGKDQGTVLFTASLPKLPRTIAMLRGTWRAAVIAAWVSAALPIAVAGALGVLDLLGPATGTLLGAIALFIASRAR
jgi:cation transport ATPase